MSEDRLSRIEAKIDALRDRGPARAIGTIRRELEREIALRLPIVSDGTYSAGYYDALKAALAVVETLVEEYTT